MRKRMQVGSCLILGPPRRRFAAGEIHAEEYERRPEALRR